MQLNDISKEVLRNFYDQCFGVDGRYPVPDEAYATDDFPTYCALRSILYPKASARDHAEEMERFQHLAADLPTAPGKPPGPQVWFQLAGKKDEDLTSAPIPRGVTSLLVNRCKIVQNWHHLAQSTQLETLSVILCSSSASEQPPAKPIDLNLLTLCENDANTSRWFLNYSITPELDLTWYASPTFDCGWIKHGSLLKQLRLTAPLIQGFERFEANNLTSIMIHHVELDQALRSFLAGQLQLSHLDIAPVRPCLPEAFQGIIEKLDNLTIPAWEEYREPWIEWALANPQVRCRFQNEEASALPSSIARAEVASIHRDYPILALTKGKTTKYELSTDLMGLYPDADLSNGEIEQLLQPLAKAAKKKISWSSEADTFVANSKSIDDLIWLIDTVLDSRPGTEQA